MTRILVVDDDAGLRSTFEEVLAELGIDTDHAQSVAQARERLAEGAPDALLVDLMLPDGSGLDLLDAVDPTATRVIVVTGHPDVDAAVRALRARVHDFLLKPVDLQRLRALVQSLQGNDGTPRRNGAREHKPRGAQSALVGESPAMRSVFDAIERVAPTDANVLLVGESGTGKELVAQAIHEASARGAGPFLAINCGALPAELIGSELFGHERGSFTGATRQHKGVFERASGGTLFLDEITEMPAELQSNLLRVLETSTFRRIGGSGDMSCDVRIVAATNRDPEEAVATGGFREDLYFRLTVFPIHLPLLRERPGDIALLAEHILAQLNAGSDSGKSFAPGAVAMLEHHDWPGNVRELWNVIQRAHILADDAITPAQLDNALSAGRRFASAGRRLGVGATIRDVERKLIEDTLEHYDGDKRTAAQVLGISLKTLYNRLKEYEQS
jgi:DNA-binding NtrC family response regulator